MMNDVDIVLTQYENVYTYYYGEFNEFWSGFLLVCKLYKAFDRTTLENVPIINKVQKDINEQDDATDAENRGAQTAIEFIKKHYE